MSKNGDNIKSSNHKNNGPGNGEDKEVMPGFKETEKKIESDHLKKLIKEEPEVEGLVKEMKVLQKELEGSKKTGDDYLDRLKRLQADYDNYRKRTLKENLAYIKRANMDLIEKILPIIDNFELALATGEKQDLEEDEFFKGVKMIHGKLMELLKKENVKVIDPHGEEFDPRVCEAAVTEAVKDTEEGKILEVMRKGYMIDDFLLRPAVVKVCKKN